MTFGRKSEPVVEDDIVIFDAGVNVVMKSVVDKDAAGAAGISNLGAV